MRLLESVAAFFACASFGNTSQGMGQVYPLPQPGGDGPLQRHAPPGMQQSAPTRASALVGGQALQAAGTVTPSNAVKPILARLCGVGLAKKRASESRSSTVHARWLSIWMAGVYPRGAGGLRLQPSRAGKAIGEGIGSELVAANEALHLHWLWCDLSP